MVNCPDDVNYIFVPRRIFIQKKGHWILNIIDIINQTRKCYNPLRGKTVDVDHVILFV